MKLYFKIKKIKYLIYSKCIFLLIVFLAALNKESIKTIKYINVSYSIDENYHYIAHVSMKSIMINQNDNTFILFYIMIPSKWGDDKKKIINQICEEHKNCNITFIEMNNNFNEYDVGKRGLWTTAMFYRIELQNILYMENKILYLDCDTLIYKDLNEIYNINIKNKYYIGMLSRLQLKKFGFNLHNSINSGVMLINLDQLRKDNISTKIRNFLDKYQHQLDFPDQDAINAICNQKNGYFHPKYVVSGYCNINLIKDYVNSLFIKVKLKDVIQSYKDPYIYHLIIYSKPWKGIPNFRGIVCFDPMTRFYEMARKTSYYYEIMKNVKVNLKHIYNYSIITKI